MTGQNRSHAVMSQRIEAHDSLDHSPTPPWATRALCEHVINIDGKFVWEPACAEGAMVRTLAEYADHVVGTDVHDYGAGYGVHDFLMPFAPERIVGVDWIITNPPFRLAEQFIFQALRYSRVGAAMLVRSVFTESVGRYERLFSVRPPAIVAQFTERVPMLKGRLEKDASSATAYAWLVWTIEPHAGTEFKWIPPCRKVLERPGDYESPAT